MGYQDNSFTETAMADLLTALTEMAIFAEVSSTPKGPEENQLYPSAYYVVGDLERVAADVQHVLYHQEQEFVVFFYVHDGESDGEISAIEGLGMKLAWLQKQVLNKMDSCTKGLFESHGYLMEATKWETDGAALAMSGSPMAMAKLTLTAKFPPKQVV